MNLIEIIGVLLLIGVLLWALNELPFVEGAIKKIINILVVVATALWLLSLTFPGVNNTFNIGN